MKTEKCCLNVVNNSYEVQLSLGCGEASKRQLLDIKHSEDQIWGNHHPRKRELIVRKKTLSVSFRMKVVGN